MSLRDDLRRARERRGLAGRRQLLAQRCPSCGERPPMMSVHEFGEYEDGRSAPCPDCLRLAREIARETGAQAMTLCIVGTEDPSCPLCDAEEELN